MFISVVIPIYNVSISLLKRCIESIFQQYDNDLEVIIVDDGSEEKNTVLYKALCSKYEGIRYFKKDNSGPSATRNYGVEKAKGDYILFLDADDYITDNCISQAKNTIKKYNPDIVFGYVYKDLADEGVIKFKESTKLPEEFIIDDYNSMANLTNHILGYESSIFLFENGYLSDGPCARFFKRSLFLNNYFDIVPRWNEDTLWNIELLRKCNKVVICKSLWYIYAVRKGSAMQGYRSNCYEEFMYITRKVSKIGYSIWDGNIDKGISYRVWHDLFILSRALIFNRKNKETLLKRYSILKSAIKSESYQIAIKKVDFSFEKRKIRRNVKEIMNMTMKKRLYPITYLILKIYLGKA